MGVQEPKLRRSRNIAWGKKDMPRAATRLSGRADIHAEPPVGDVPRGGTTRWGLKCKDRIGCVFLAVFDDCPIQCGS